MTALLSTTKTKEKFVINIITGQGGGGHYAAYRAICAIAEQYQLPWQIDVTDMDDIITDLAQQNKVANAYEMMGFSGHDLYNLMLKSGWTWLWWLKMRLNKFLVKLNYQAGLEFFEQYWRDRKPDLVVSVMPLYNKGLSESLQRAKPGTPYVTVPVDLADYPPAFTQDVPYYMHLADFFIGKPGPGSISEALAMKLPIVTECNFSTLIHEKYNAEWVKEKEVGLVVRDFHSIEKAVKQFLEPQIFARYRSNVAALNNRAIFELCELLQQILASRYPSKMTQKETI